MTRIWVAWILSMAACATSVSIFADDEVAPIQVAPEPTVRDDSVKQVDPYVADDNVASDVELIHERYPNRAVKIEREVIRDAEDHYVNHGSWKMWDVDGNLVGEGRYRDGERQGTWTAWFFAGEVELLKQTPYKQFPGPLISRATFEHGKLHGKWTIYDNKNRKISEWEYADGQRHGLWTMWYINGRKMRDVNYANDLVHGEVFEWSPEGKLLVQGTYDEGRCVARKVEFHNQKQKKSEGTYLFARHTLAGADDWWNLKLAAFKTEGKDVRHGEWNAWYDNGQSQMKGQYEHDTPVGRFTWYFSNGQIALEGEYLNGHRDGKWTWYHPKGQTSIQGQFKSVGPEGEWIWWNEDGKVAQRVEYAADSDAIVVQDAEGSIVADKKDVAESQPGTLSDPQAESLLVPQSVTAPEPLEIQR